MKIPKCFSEKACYLNVLSQTGDFSFHITAHFKTLSLSWLTRTFGWLICGMCAKAGYMLSLVCKNWRSLNREHAVQIVMPFLYSQLWGVTGTSPCGSRTGWLARAESVEHVQKTLQPSSVAVPRCSVTSRSTVALPKRKTHVKRICHLPGFPPPSPKPHTLWQVSISWT